MIIDSTKKKGCIFHCQAKINGIHDCLEYESLKVKVTSIYTEVFSDFKDLSVFMYFINILPKVSNLSENRRLHS